MKNEVLRPDSCSCSDVYSAAKCQYHDDLSITSSSLGLGWTRGTERCRTHPEISEHRNVRGKWPKADRGINKNFSQFIMKRTGHLVHVGSGRYFDVPLVLIFFTCMQTFCPTSDCIRNVQKMQGNFVFIFEEEKLPKLSEEKPSPVVAADDDDDDVVITKMKELTMVRAIVINSIRRSKGKT